MPRHRVLANDRLAQLARGLLSQVLLSPRGSIELRFRDRFHVCFSWLNQNTFSLSLKTQREEVVSEPPRCVELTNRFHTLTNSDALVDVADSELGQIRPDNIQAVLV